MHGSLVSSHYLRVLFEPEKSDLFPVNHILLIHHLTDHRIFDQDLDKNLVDVYVAVDSFEFVLNLFIQGFDLFQFLLERGLDSNLQLV